MTKNKRFLDLLFLLICPAGAFYAPLTPSGFTISLTLFALSAFWLFLRVVEFFAPRVEVGVIGEEIR